MKLTYIDKETFDKINAILKTETDDLWARAFYGQLEEIDSNNFDNFIDRLFEDEKKGIEALEEKDDKEKSEKRRLGGDREETTRFPAFTAMTSPERKSLWRAGQYLMTYELFVSFLLGENESGPNAKEIQRKIDEQILSRFALKLANFEKYEETSLTNQAYANIGRMDQSLLFESEWNTIVK